MAFEGFIDSATDTKIRGWVYDNASADQPVSLEIVANGRVVATIVADLFRRDLLNNGKGNGCHGFFYSVSAEKANGQLLARMPGRRWMLPFSESENVNFRTVGRLAHSLEYGFPSAPSGFTEASPSSNELEIVTRLIAAFHRALADDPSTADKRKEDVWSGVAERGHGEILKLIGEHNVQGTADYLRDAHARWITFGITQGESATRELRAHPEARQMILAEYLDALSSLAEYLCVFDVESAEQRGQWGENLHRDPEETIEKIEKVLGISIVPPQVISSGFGIETKSGIISGRDLCALYAAIRQREILNDLNIQNPSICEIGGGLGGAAYYANRLGQKPYTIIDLPLINLLQGYFLARSLPDQKVCFYGEDETCAAITLLPTWKFTDDNRKYDLLFNQDSIPEMHVDYALGYLKQASHNIRHVFLSINQEARAPQNEHARQTVVREIAQSAGQLNRSARFRHWIRPGYVEEIYKIAR